MGMDGVMDVLKGKFLKPPLTSSRSPWIVRGFCCSMSVSRFVWEGPFPLNWWSQEYEKPFVCDVTYITAGPPNRAYPPDPG
jgi:hypothetical protein